MPSLVFSFESASENSADRWLLFIASWECLVLNRLRIKYSSVTGKNIKNILFAHKHTPIHTHTQCRVFLSYSLSPTLLSSVMVRNLLQRCCISVCVRGRQKSGEENMNSYTYKESCTARTAYVACISARRTQWCDAYESVTLAWLAQNDRFVSVSVFSFSEPVGEVCAAGEM